MAAIVAWRFWLPPAPQPERIWSDIVLVPSFSATIGGHSDLDCDLSSFMVVCPVFARITRIKNAYQQMFLWILRKLCRPSYTFCGVVFWTWVELGQGGHTCGRINAKRSGMSLELQYCMVVDKVCM